MNLQELIIWFPRYLLKMPVSNICQRHIYMCVCKCKPVTFTRGWLWNKVKCVHGSVWGVCNLYLHYTCVLFNCASHLYMYRLDTFSVKKYSYWASLHYKLYLCITSEVVTFHFHTVWCKMRVLLVHLLSAQNKPQCWQFIGDGISNNNNNNNI